MTEVDLILSENENFRYLLVDFGKDTGAWTYKTLDTSIEVDDLVLVPVERNGNKTTKLATVVEIASFENININIPVKWIIQKVDRSNYDKCLELEAKISERLRKVRAEKLKRDLINNLSEELGEDKLNDLRKETLINLETDNV